jgi:hypothetical protein
MAWIWNIWSQCPLRPWQLHHEKQQMARSSLSPAFLLPQILTFPLFKLLPLSNPSSWLASLSGSSQPASIGLRLRPCWWSSPYQSLPSPSLTSPDSPSSPEGLSPHSLENPPQTQLHSLHCPLPTPSCGHMHPPTCSCLCLPIPTWFPFFHYKRWQEWKGQLGSISLFLWYISPKLNNG